MCGMCGAGAGDPFGALVAGPRRRGMVAESLSRRLPRHVVTPFVSGWTVSNQTGSTRVFQTIDGLILFVAETAGIAAHDLRADVFADLDATATEG